MTTLFEDFVEPFDNLDQWTVLGGIGTAPIPGSGIVSFPVTTGLSVNRRIITNDFYELDASYVSFQILSVGSYPEVVGTFGLGGLLTGYALLNYPGNEGMLTLTNGVNVFAMADDTQPYIAFYQSGTDIIMAYSENGTSWNTLGQVAISSLNPSGDGYKLIMGDAAFGAAGSDYVQQFGNINQVNPLIPAGPSLTEVDAAPLVMEWNIGQWMLRHSTRHLHRTVFDYLNDQLTAMGWTVEGDVPFNAPVVTLQDVLPDEWDEASVLEPGTVALTLGDEDAALNQEMGGPLALIQVPFFVDCFMDTDSTALALALDIRDIFTGRAPGSVRFLDVINYNPDTPQVAVGYTVEFDDVIRQRVKKSWHVVKITAMLYFPDAEGA